MKINNDITFKVDIAGRIEHRMQPGVTPGAADPSASTDNGGATMGYKNIIYYAIAAAPVVNPRMPNGTYIGYNNPLIARDESGFSDRKTKSGSNINEFSVRCFKMDKRVAIDLAFWL